jgi:hypothetical protein
MKEKTRKAGRPKLPKGEVKNVVAVRFSSEDMRRIERFAKTTKQTVSDSIRNSSAPPDPRAAQAAEFPNASLYVWDDGGAWSGLVVLKDSWQMIQIKAADEHHVKSQTLALAEHSQSGATWKPVAMSRRW